MPDKHRRAELPPLDEDTRAEQEPWLGYVIFLGFVVIAIVVALSCLRNPSRMGPATALQ